MDFDSLNAFLQVARLNSFSQAAEKLYLTQPAVSKRIANLESQLGTRLFDRIGHQTQLTDAGEALIPRAERILLDLQDTHRMIANLSGKIRGQLKIGTSHHIGLHRLPKILKAYRKHYPLVDLDLRFMESEVIHEKVQNGELELGIVTLPTNPLPSLQHTALWDDPLGVVCANDHDLASVRSCTIRRLTEYPAVLPAEDTFTRQLLNQALGPHVKELDCQMTTNNLETLKMLSSIGMGWSLLPETMLDRRLHIVEVKALRLQRTLGVVQHTKRTLSNAARALTELAKN